MKIYISSDMEGATGVVHVNQTMSDQPEYIWGCKMETHDVKAVVRGAFEAGADEVLVNDSHGRMTNLNINEFSEEFDDRLRILLGSPKMFGMVEGFKEADGAFFVGYHAMAGTPFAVLDHTISGTAVHSISLNGREVGEIALNAALCAAEGVPVALVTGDDAACAEGKALLGEELVTASTKTAHGRMSANCLVPRTSATVLQKAAEDAVQKIRDKRAPRMEIEDAFCLDVTFRTTAQCDIASTIPGTERLGGRTCRVRGNSMYDMRRWVGALVYLGATR